MTRCRDELGAWVRESAHRADSTAALTLTPTYVGALMTRCRDELGAWVRESAHRADQCSTLPLCTLAEAR